MSKILRVTAKRDGFRRGGRAWPAQSTDVDPKDLTEAQLDAIRAEPMLVVEEVDARAEKAGAKAEK